MALKASTRLFPLIARRKIAVGWGGALVVGLVVANWRSITGHVGSCGDIRTRYWRNLGLLRRPVSLLSISKRTMPFEPPQPPRLWNHNAEDILKLTKEAIEYDRAVQDRVGGLDPKDCTFESVSFNIIVARESRV